MKAKFFTAFCLHLKINYEKSNEEAHNISFMQKSFKNLNDTFVCLIVDSVTCLPSTVEIY